MNLELRSARRRVKLAPMRGRTYLPSSWTPSRCWVAACVLLTIACRTSAPLRAVEQPTPATTSRSTTPQASGHSPCTWTVQRLPEIGAVTLEAISGGLVFIVGDAKRLISTNYGATFDKPSLLASDIPDTSEEPGLLSSNGRTLYFATPSKVLAIDVDRVRRLRGPGSGLPDEGSLVLAEFKATSTGLYALLNRPNNAPRIVAEGELDLPRYESHLYRSLDEGATWVDELRLDALEHGEFTGLLINGAAQRWVRDKSGPWLSTLDDGANWARLPQLPADGWLVAGRRSLLLMAMHRRGDNPLYRSPDSGNTWYPVGDGVSLDNLVEAADGDWSATKGSHFLRSLDDGLHWHQESNSTRDELAAECLSAEIVSWTSFRRFNDEGYALGWVDPDLNLTHRTRVADKGMLFLAHGTCSPALARTGRAL